MVHGRWLDMDSCSILQTRPGRMVPVEGEQGGVFVQMGGGGMLRSSDLNLPQRSVQYTSM